jgi:peptidoglycan hydrolase-like protein with peptidoglycan-binding domain
MQKRNLILILSFIFLFLSFSSVKAECPLNLNNLSISNQTNKDKADIIRLQSILYINDLYDGPITGYYGKLTTAAINNLKKQYNLTQDGIVDKDIINIICSNYTLCPFKSNLENPSEYPKKEIKFIQYFLRSIPDIYPEKLVTGYYGPKTENAVKNLQKYLNIDSSGKIDIFTRQEFCKFFYSFNSNLINQKTSTNTTSIFQTLCLAFPKKADTGKSVLFISQILGGNPPYKYIWNNENKYNDKTFKVSFNKPGDQSVNLKVIDSIGNISSSNCSVEIIGEEIADTSQDWIAFDIEDTKDLENNNNTTSGPEKYLHSNQYWTSGWTCYPAQRLFNQYVCQKIQKTKSIFNKVIYNIAGHTLEELPQSTMIYSTENECKQFCSKEGDENTFAINERVTTTRGTPTKATKFAQSEMEALIQNPLKLDLEVLPKEIIVGDPVKIHVINMPPFVRQAVDDNLISVQWSGDIFKQYQDATIGFYEYGDHVFIDENNKPLTNGEKTQARWANGKPNYGLLVPKTIPEIYCGDGKCHFKESDPSNPLYCRKDCLNNKNIVYNPKISVKTNTKIQNILFDSLTRQVSKTSTPINTTMTKGRDIYWTFNKPGNYNIGYSIYYNSKLIGSVNNYNIQVIKKPTSGNYMKMFLTYDEPEKSKVECPTNFYWIDPKTEELIYITPSIARFKNEVSKYSSLPYRDLDGNLISFDWNHLYVESIKNGGDMWNFGSYDTSYPSSFPGAGILSVPLIADEKYTNKLKYDISNSGNIDYNVINKPKGMYYNIDLGSKYYQPFSCRADSPGQKCIGVDSAASVIFGYQNFQDKHATQSSGWRSDNLTTGNIYSGSGIQSNVWSKSRTLCIEEPLRDETPVSKRNPKYYTDLTLSNFQVGEIQNNKREVTIDVTNLGEQPFKTKSEHSMPLVRCNRLDNGTGENIGNFLFHTYNTLNPNSKITLKATFDCRLTDTTQYGTTNILPAIKPNTKIACIVDPTNLEEESNEYNNLLTNITFSCE